MIEEEDDNLIDEDTIRYMGRAYIIKKKGDKLKVYLYGAAELKEPYSDSILLLGKVA